MFGLRFAPHKPQPVVKLSLLQNYGAFVLP